MPKKPETSLINLPRRSPFYSVEFWIKVVKLLSTIVGLTAMVLQYGFIRPVPPGVPVPQPPAPIEILRAMQFLAIGGFILALWMQVLLVPGRRTFIRDHIIEMLASIAAVAGIFLVLMNPPWLTHQQVSAILLGLTAYLVVQLLIVFVKFNAWMVRLLVYPGRAIIFGFATLIFIGSLLLSLPAASTADRFTGFWNNFVDHLFTATSAVCVTGLVVRDTGTAYSPFGQLVIMILFQMGGLGIIIFGTIFTLLLGRQISIQEASLVKDLYSQESIGQVGKIVKFIVISTLAVEAIGAVLMLGLWDTPYLSERIFKSVFHAVSAFCNAGFSLQPDSLVRFADKWQTYFVISPLVILGGLGFPVLINLSRVLRHKIRPTVRFPKNLDLFRVTVLSLHTKIVLTMTGILIVMGMISFFAIETTQSQDRWGRRMQYEDIVVRADPTVMRNRPFHQRTLDAFFLSVTSRTAGFNTVDTQTSNLNPGTQIILMSLMFIGGGPASTAGGIKVVTFMVIAATVIAALRRRTHVDLFHRTIDLSIIRRALVVLMVFTALLWSVAFALALTHPQFNFMDILFEATSACATVGLSTGITPQLTISGRIIVVVGMFAGRLGPLTMLFAMLRTTRRVRYEYPREGLITG